MNTILIVMAVYLVPMMLALVLYGSEYIKDRIQGFFQRRAVNKRLDNLNVR